MLGWGGVLENSGMKGDKGREEQKGEREGFRDRQQDGKSEKVGEMYRKRWMILLLFDMVKNMFINTQTK